MSVEEEAERNSIEGYRNMIALARLAHDASTARNGTPTELVARVKAINQYCDSLTPEETRCALLAAVMTIGPTVDQYHPLTLDQWLEAYGARINTL